MTDMSDCVTLTAEIVSAFVSSNKIPAQELAGLIRQVYRALEAAVSDPKAPEAPTLAPAVSIRRSVTPDYLISLEDGRKYKSLKRHLSTRGMTPDDYRAKWGLPRDYPMVAANYSAQRSQLARALGLGQGGRTASAETEVAPETAATSARATRRKSGEPAAAGEGSGPSVDAAAEPATA